MSCTYCFYHMPTSMSVAHFLSSTTFILRLQVSVSMVSNHSQEPGNEARPLLDFTQQGFIQDCFVGRGNLDV